ncbi:hypothetical protein GGI18_002871 [Coemansia linderi]|uniref:Uncharacterized protein n=1 Tax=Coemansia linderi TaxID=2663919 RepID=A0ACC1KE25_9FUNG|nr:hypothetical protein GGI18_002871 [Coemansia linderi]
MPPSPVPPKSATYTRSSLGLFTSSGDMGSGSSPRSPQQRNATTIGTTSTHAAQASTIDAGDRQQAPDGDAPAGNPERRRASRRQSEDTMRAMRSLDRQYGRRRRLNSDYPRTGSVDVAPMLPDASQRSTSTRTRSPPGASNSRSRQALRRGDSRALFAPLCLPQPETVLAVNVSPSYDPSALPLQSPAAVVPAGGGSARLARQLMMIAGRLAQQGSLVQGPVRPRASMPLINGAHRPLQRNRSHVARRTKDELSDALTMKSVEIRGGRIVLDDPSSSDDSGEESYASSESNRESVARIFGRRRPSVGSSACTSAVETQNWEDDLRRRWYTRRCLASRQPFASVHRLAKAEHDSEEPRPLLNDLRRVLAEVGARYHVEGAATTEPVNVLLCSDAILVCASGRAGSRQPLRVVEFSDDPSVRVTSDCSVEISDDEHRFLLEFAPGYSARPWVEQVVQAQARLSSVLQDLRLDEEDYVDRPPLPLLARGRSSIAGTAAHADNVSVGGAMPLRMRNAAQGGVYWVPDAETHVCMVCQKTAFSMMVRRHHCRACGLIICYRCSTVDAQRHRLCVRCDVTGRPPLASNARPSLHTLGRRAAEYLPSGDLVMQMAAQREAASSSDQLQPPALPVPLGRRKNDRLVRRPISSLFPAVDSTEETSVTKID